MRANIKTVLMLSLLVGGMDVLAFPITSSEEHSLEETKTQITSGQQEEEVAAAAAANESNQNERMDPQALEDNEEEPDTCPVCRDDFLESPPFELLCGHQYHLDCLKQFYLHNNRLEKCFLCQTEIKVRNGMSLVEWFNDEERREVVHNKLKMGVMAGYDPRPSGWELQPKHWFGDLYW